VAGPADRSRDSVDALYRIGGFFPGYWPAHGPVSPGLGRKRHCYRLWHLPSFGALLPVFRAC
jgi:hypothetical protein